MVGASQTAWQVDKTRVNQSGEVNIDLSFGSLTINLSALVEESMDFGCQDILKMDNSQIDISLYDFLQIQVDILQVDISQMDISQMDNLQ